MNRKKLSAIILAALISSSKLYSTAAHAQTPNVDARTHILSSYAEALTFDSFDQHKALRYVVTTDKVDLDNVLTNISKLSAGISIVSYSADTGEIRISLADKDSSLLDQIYKDPEPVIVGVTGLHLDAEALNFNNAAANDSSIKLYTKINSGYVNIKKFSNNLPSPEVYPSIKLDSSAAYLSYELTTIDNSAVENKTTGCFSNLAAGDYVLPFVDSSNLSSIVLKYNLQDAGGNIIKNAQQTISSEQTAPVLTFEQNINYSVNASDATLSFRIKAEDSSQILSQSAFYINKQLVSPLSVTPVEGTGFYDVTIKVPTGAPWELEVFMADEAFNIGKAVLFSDFLLNFDNVVNNRIITGPAVNSKLSVLGSVPSEGTINNFKINGVTADITGNSFSAAFDSTSQNVTAEYEYTTKDSANKFSVNYSLDYSIDSSAPVLSNIAYASGQGSVPIAANSNIYLNNGSFNLSGKISDNYFKNALAISSIEFSYNNGLTVLAPASINFDKDTGNFSALLNLNDSGDGSLPNIVTIKSKDKFNNETSFSFKVYVDKTNPEVSNINIDNNKSYKSSYKPQVAISESNLDLSKSYFEVTKKDGTPAQYYFDNAKVKYDNGSFMLEDAFSSDGSYNIKVHLVDRSGNESLADITRDFLIDSVGPEITIADMDNVINGFTHSDSVTPSLSVTDEHLKTSFVTIKRGATVVYSGSFKNAINLVIIDEGVYNMRIDAEDDAGNLSFKEANFTIDRTNPLIKSINLTNNSFYSVIHEPKVTVEESNLNKAKSYFEVTKDKILLGRYYFDSSNVIISDGEYQLNDVIKNDGKYEVRVHVVDMADNVVDADSITSFCLDTTNPVIISDSITDGHYYTEPITPSITITEANLDESKSYFAVETSTGKNYYFFSDKTYVGFKDGSYQLNGVITTGGTYKLTVHLVDMADNRLPADLNKTFSVDSVNPAISDSNFAANRYLKNAEDPYVVIDEVNLDTDSSYFEVEYNGSSKKYYLSNKNMDKNYVKLVDDKYILTGVVTADGAYNVKAHLADKASNYIDTAYRTLIVDSTLPEINEAGLIDGHYYRTAEDPYAVINEINLDSANSYFEVNYNGSVEKYYLSDGNFILVNGNKYTLRNVIKADGIYKVKMHIADLSGNFVENNTKTFYIDSEAAKPEIVNITHSFYNGAVIPRIEIKDMFLGESDVNTLIKATLDGKPYTLTFAGKKDGVLILEGAAITENSLKGTEYNLTVFVQDKAAKDGSEAAQSNRVSFVIDTTAVSINVRDKYLGELIDGRYYKGSITPVVTINENYEVDYKSVKIKIGDVIRDCNGTWDGLTFTGETFEADENYTLLVEARDKASSMNTVFEISFTIDNTMPTISVTGVEDTLYYSSNSKTISVTISDTNKDLSSTTFKLTRNNSEVIINPVLLNGVYSFTVEGDGDYKLSVTSTDKAGNQFTSKDITFTLDTVSPVIVLDSDNIVNGFYYDQPFDPYFTADEINLSLSKSYFEVIVDGNVNTSKKYYLSDNEVSKLGNGKYLLKDIIKNDGTYEVKIYLEDNAGNSVKPILDKTFYIDTKSPDAAFSGVLSDDTPDYVQQLLPEFTFEDRFLTEQLLLSGSQEQLAESGVNPNYINVKLDGKTYKMSLVSAVPTDHGTTMFTLRAVNPIAKDSYNQGKHMLTVDITDMSNRKTSYTKTIYLDTVVPQLTPTIEFKDADGSLKAITAGHIYHAPVNINISIADNVNIEKSSITAKLKKDGLEIKTYTLADLVLNEGNGFSLSDVIEQNGDYEILVTAVDKAGNAMAPYTVSFTIDNDKPVISVTGLDSVINGHTQLGDITVNVDVKDAHYSYMTITIEKDGKVIKQETKYELSQFSYNIKDLAGEADGVYKVTVQAFDKAEPVNFESFETTFVLDVTKPVIKEDNIKDGFYYRNLFDPSVLIEETNLDLNNSYFEVNIDNKTAVKYYLSNNDFVKLEDGRYYLRNVVKEDGIYNVKVHLVDKARNEMSPDFNETFYVDREVAVPVITNIEKSFIKNYNGDMVPRIEIKDMFLDKEDVNTIITATLNGKAYTLNFVSKKDGVLILEGAAIAVNNLRATDYDLKIFVKDRTARDNGENAQTDEVHFVVDKEVPTIILSEKQGRAIVEGSYNQGKFTPVITFEDNYVVDWKSVRLKFNATVQDYSGTWEQTEKGYIFTGTTLTEDGVYTLYAEAKDRATNEAVKLAITFTIDNTNPNIEITGADNNSFNNNEATTISIDVTDTNNELGNTTFKLTRNGSEVAINPKLYNGIFSFTVAEEGEYKLVATAADKAGNITTSEVRTFTIDRTKPIVKFNFNEGDFINKAFKPVIVTEKTDDWITEVIIDGESFSPNALPTLVNNKEYIIKAKGKDKAGNESDEVTIKFVLDTQAPVVNIKPLLSGTFNNKNIKPDISWYDMNLASAEILLNDKPYNQEEISAEGTYQLRIIVRDKANNVTDIPIEFVIDKTGPRITIFGVMNNEYLKSLLKPLIDVNDVDANIIMMLDGEDYSGEEITKDGKHTLMVKAVDKAGNVTQTLLTFFIKTTLPQLSITGVDEGARYTVPVKPLIEKDEDATFVSLTLNGKSFNLDQEISALGDYELVAIVRDQAGNETKKTVKFAIVKESLITRFFANKPLAATSGGGLAAILGGLGWFFFRKKFKK